MINKITNATAPIKAKANNSRGIESGFKVSQALVAATPTIIGLWDLETTHTEEKPPEAAFYRPNSLQVDESIVGDDARTLVKAEDFAEGGKYRCIVKLMARMEGHDAQDPWMMGTGWLIAPDLIVTAGHMSFDWDHKFGFAKEMKAWIGYYGRDNVGDNSVQLRHGQTVATPAEWIKAPRENYDVSFIKVDKPFTGVKPMVYSDTPAKGNLDLGVVGYPGDRLSPGDSAYGEHMYEMFLPTDFDLATSNKLLQYKIDTFGGNSGSPVLVKDDMKAIGVHVLGADVNSASVIGPFGNVFQHYKGSFLAKTDPAFDMTTKVPSRVKSFRVVSIPSKNERDSTSSNIKKATSTESLTESSTSLFGSLRSLLDSSIRAHENPENFLGKLKSLLEPSMVNAMSDTCNGAEGLVKALQFLWHSNKDSPANTESLLTTLAKHAKHDFTAKKILKVGEKIGERTPAGMVLRYGLDAANAIGSSNDESLMDHIATGLSVTVPMVHKELPKLGSIGVPIAAIAASALRSVGAHAAASLSSDTEPSNPAPESALAPKSALKEGTNERAILAETALHGIMRLDKGDLKHYQVYEKMHAIIKPLAHIVRRADPMLSLIMQPTITKVALASLKTPEVSSDASQGKPATPQSPSPNPESLTYKGVGGIRPKIGATTQDSTPVDEPLSAFTEALVAAHPDLEDTLPEMVKRGMQLDNGAFSNATLFGLPIVLGGGLESEYYDRNAESAVAVSGLAQRAMLAEAALQVMLQLPVDVIKTLEVPNIRPTIDAFKTEGEDEAEQSTPAQVVTATAASVAAASSSLSTYLSHSDKLKDQKQKEKDQQQKDKDHELTKIGQNMTAHTNNMEQPHKDVFQWEQGEPARGDGGDRDHGGSGGHGGPAPLVAPPSRAAPPPHAIPPPPRSGGRPAQAATGQDPVHSTASLAERGEADPSAHHPPKEEVPKPKAEEPISKGKEPRKVEEPLVHAGSSSNEPKEKEPKEEPKPKKPSGFAAPTVSSVAKRAPAKREGGGKREGLIEEDPESLIAEDFVSGFASM